MSPRSDIYRPPLNTRVCRRCFVLSIGDTCQDCGCETYSVSDSAFFLAIMANSVNPEGLRAGRDYVDIGPGGWNGGARRWGPM